MFEFQPPSIEDVQKHHATAIRALRLRDVYFAMNYFLLSVLPPINEQGDDRRFYQSLGLGLIATLEALTIAFEVVKAKKLLSPDFEKKLDRIFRHGINGVKDIAIIFTFIQVAAFEISPEEMSESSNDHGAIVELANWLNHAEWYKKLGLVGGLSTLKAGAGYFLNRKEFPITKSEESYDTALIKTPLYERKFGKLTGVRILSIAAMLYLKGVVFAAIDLMFLNDFNVMTSEEFNKLYLFIKPAIITVLYLVLLDHPGSPYKAAKQAGRFINRFFVMALENAEITAAVIFNLLSYFADNENFNLSNTSAITILLASYSAAAFPAEAHYNITAVCNDADAHLQNKSKTTKFLHHMSLAGLSASVIFPHGMKPWYALYAVGALTDLIKLAKFPKKGTKAELIINSPKNIIKAFSDGALVVIAAQSYGSTMSLGINSTIAASTGGVLFALDYFGKKRRPLQVAYNIIQAALLGNASVKVLNSFPAVLNPNLSMPWYIAASLSATAIVAAIEGRKIYLKKDHPKVTRMLSKAGKAGLGMLLPYSMAMNNYNEDENLTGVLSTVIFLLMLASTLYYLLYRNKGGEGIANKLGKFGICRPKFRHGILNDDDGYVDNLIDSPQN